MKILFADDEAFAHQSLIDRLRLNQHQVQISMRHATWILRDLGATGLAENKKWQKPDIPPPYDLIILDVQLPTGEEQCPGGALEGYNKLNAGVGVYRYLRQSDDPGLEWARRDGGVKVLIFTVDNSKPTKRSCLEIAGSQEGKNLAFFYKPGFEVLRYILDFIDTR